MSASNESSTTTTTTTTTNSNKPQDCTSCRVISTAFLVGIGVYFLSEARRPKGNWKSWQLRAAAYPFIGAGVYSWARPSLETLSQGSDPSNNGPNKPTQ